MLRGCAAAIDAKSVKTMLAASIGTSQGLVLHPASASCGRPREALRR